VTSHEVRFAVDHADKYYLYRIFDFEETSASGKMFVQRGDLGSFSLTAVQFKVELPVAQD
jgi:hypothetical protein